MPTTHNWIIASGTATVAAASFDTATLPVTGDTVNIMLGSADITGGLTALSGVTLAALNIGGSFSGTIGTTGNSGDSLVVSATLLTCNCISGRIKIDVGSVQTTVVVKKTGPSKDTGLEAIRVLGSHASNKVYVAGDSNTTFGSATTRGGMTATWSEWDVQSGSLTLGAGATWTTGNLSGSGTANINSAGTTINTSGGGCTLNTGGAGAITTINATGRANLNHRPAAGTDFIATLSIASGGSVDTTGDPRPATLTNAIVMAAGASMKTFNPTQLALHAASLDIKCQQCGLKDVTIDMGAQTKATITGW